MELPRLAAPPPLPGRTFFVYSADERSAGRGRQSPKILVVEDDYLVGSDIEGALIAAGFTVTGVVTTADEAVSAALADRPNLILMDVRLRSRRDGIDAAIDIFDKSGIRCLFATAHGDAITRQRAGAASPLGWVQKPFSLPSLVTAVRAALANMKD